MDDPRLVLVEGQAPGCQPLCQPCLDLFRLPLAVAERDQVICVADHRRGTRRDLTGVNTGQAVPDSGGLLQPVQGDVQEHG